jgi:CDGSH-type Zn-finger protein
MLRKPDAERMGLGGGRRTIERIMCSSSYHAARRLVNRGPVPAARERPRMSDTTKIVVTPAGPYLVSGGVSVEVQSMEPLPGGDSWTWEPKQTIEAGERYALCRCGGSAKKPFCDGTHTAIDWQPAETASRAPYAEGAKTLDGPTMTLHDNEALCAFARFCDNKGRIWNLIAQTDDAAVRETVAHEATHCPSGRLVVVENATGAAVEPNFGPSIVLAEDTGKECSGPIWVRGGIRIESQDGTPYETRNRVTLCRCGKSSNKPFCDGTHADVAFDDGLR